MELDDEKVFNLQIKQRKAIISANKTIITLCNYIAKLTEDDKALKKAAAEIKKARKVLERDESIDNVLGKLVDLRCQRIAWDNEMSDEEKEANIQGFQNVHQRYTKKA